MEKEVKRRVFKVFTYRGVPVEELAAKPLEEIIPFLPSRVRRKFSRGTINTYKLKNFMAKLAKAKEDAPRGMKPKSVRTHYRNMIVLPQMVGSIVAVHNGKVFMDVEIKPDMIGHYLGEFAITYKPVTHGKYEATLAKISNSKFYQVHY